MKATTSYRIETVDHMVTMLIDEMRLNTKGMKIVASKEDVALPTTF